jgi:catechol 2,3-dioxygenase-like lactoylglutathione lyase family enzyme
VITGFDHVVIAVRDLAAGMAAYETLLGARAKRREADGVAIAEFVTPNLNVELIAPVGSGGERVRAVLEEGEGLKSLVFAARDLDAWHRRAERVGLAPEPITADETQRSFRIGRHGVRLFCLERTAAAPAEADAVRGIDHIVIRTPEPERAAALYGARLGLDLRLDRILIERRLMFFRCGDAVLEVVRMSSLAQDDLWGLSWRVADADAAHTRLAAAGLDVSDVRAGMKPGTRVFTVRNGTCNVPTLMIEAS